MVKWAIRKHEERAMPGAWDDRVLILMTGDHRPADTWPEPPASVRAQRPQLAPEARSAFAQTNENFDAQNAWLAHTCPERSRRVEAGRIEVK